MRSDVNKKIILLTFISFGLLSAKPAESILKEETAISDPTFKELHQYTEWRFSNVSRKKMRAAQELIPKVIEYANRFRLDPLLVAVVMHAESSWKPTAYNPAKGERGLMQVHGLAAKGFDLETIDGQINAGVSYLKFCILSCGSIEGGLALYQTGYKCEPFSLSKRRYRLYKNAVRKFRKNE